MPHTNTRMICCVHACMHRNQHCYYLSKPTHVVWVAASHQHFQNMSRYKQVVRPHRRHQLATVSYKNVYFGVKNIAPPPLPSQPSSFHWMKVMTKLHCSMNFNLWSISKGESFSSCTRHEATGDISLRLCMPQNKSCSAVVKQGYSYRVLGKSFNDLSCLQNYLPTWLSPSYALRQCCQLAVVHDMWKKMTGSFSYLSCSVISDNKYKIRREIIQQL
jgi:hypothetical protein